MRQLLKQFFSLESSSGLLLLAATASAMLFANSTLGSLYQSVANASVFIVNDGLMALFFLVVGLELKRGFLAGPLADRSQVLLPLTAAIGGMLAPVLLFYLINRGDAANLRGWAIPVATDIAFALGALSLFGRRIPPSLKLFLLALAIFDDLGAIIIIAFFYATQLSYVYLSLTLLLVGLLYLFNQYKVYQLTPYLLVGFFLWLCVLKAGIHPTISGVLLALFIPDASDPRRSLLHCLESALHPWVAYGIMPMFAFMNAGVIWDTLTIDMLTSTLVVGIAAGLFIGKQLGVFGFAWLMIRLGFATLPEKTSWLALYGVGILCGIGFTMSLFLGTLSFYPSTSDLSEVRVGVIIGSILSGLVGSLVLQIATTQRKA